MENRRDKGASGQRASKLSLALEMGKKRIKYDPITGRVMEVTLAEAEAEPVAATDTDANTDMDTDTDTDTEVPLPLGEDAYRKGRERMDAQDWEGGISYWTEAANQNHEEAIKELARFFYLGYTKDFWNKDKYLSSREYIDFQQSMIWGKKGIELGLDTEWDLMLAHYERHDYLGAVYWGRRYDEKNGGAEARIRLGRFASQAFSRGLICYDEECYEGSLFWWGKAALLGDATAMFNCGMLAEKGLGRSVDLDDAAMWYEMAADRGGKESGVTS